MTFFGLLGHLAGLLAPAVAMALVLCLAPRLRRAGRRKPWSLDLGLLLLAGSVVLLAGLLFFGRDAKMATYTALVLVQGSLGWWLQRR